jgi:hypothetical protein
MGIEQPSEYMNRVQESAHAGFLKWIAWNIRNRPVWHDKSVVKISKRIKDENRNIRQAGK